MHVEVRLDGCVLRVRVLPAEGENTAYMKNSLGAIFMRIAHLVRCIHTPPDLWASPDIHACLQQSLLFRHGLQNLPPLGDSWDKGLTPFRLQRGLPKGSSYCIDTKAWVIRRPTPGPCHCGHKQQ